jgi:hypothetical protein
MSEEEFKAKAQNAVARLRDISDELCAMGMDSLGRNIAHAVEYEQQSNPWVFPPRILDSECKELVDSSMIGPGRVE